MKFNRNQLSSYLKEIEEVKGLSKHTIKAYKIDLMQFEKFVILDQNEDLKKTIYDYIGIMNHKFKPKTVKRKVASIRAFLEYLNENGGEMDLGFFHKLKIQQEKTLPRIIESDSINRIYKVLYEKKGTINTLLFVIKLL